MEDRHEVILKLILRTLQTQVEFAEACGVSIQDIQRVVTQVVSPSASSFAAPSTLKIQRRQRELLRTAAANDVLSGEKVAKQPSRKDLEATESLVNAALGKK